MAGLTINEYRQIQAEVFANNPAGLGNDPNGREVRILVDPYFKRTCEEHGWADDKYRSWFLMQAGLYPEVRVQIGDPSEFFLLARIRIVFQRCVTSLRFMWMIYFGPVERRAEYEEMRDMRAAIGEGALVHFHSLEELELQPGPAWLSTLWLNHKSYSSDGDRWRSSLSPCDKVTSLAYKLGLTGNVHESLQGSDADFNKSNSIGLYLTLNCMKSQTAYTPDWTRGSPISSLDDSEAFEFFDRMEPLAADLQEKMQNLYDACIAHCSSWTRMYEGARQDDELQECIAQFQASYEAVWSELVATADAVGQNVLMEDADKA